MTAMRTAMPKVTWGRMTAWAPSATAGMDLDPAVHRPGVHDDGVGLGEGQLLGRQAVVAGSIRRPREQGAGHALVCRRSMMTTSQSRGLPPCRGRHAPHAAEVAGQQGLGPDGAHLGDAQGGEGVNVRAGDAGMEDVANDGYPQLGEILLVVPDGVHVQESLGGVGMAAVAGVDDVDVVAADPGPGAGRSR